MTRLRDLVRLERVPGVQIPGWLDRLVSLGIVTDDPKIARRQKITNVASLAGAANSASRFVINSLNDIEHFAIVQGLVILFVVSALFIHRLHRWGENAAATALVIWFLAGVVFVVMLFGVSSQVQVYFALTGVMLFLFGLENWRLALMWIVVTLAVMCIILHYGPARGMALSADTRLLEFLSVQALVNTIVINALVILYALILLHRTESELERQRARAEALVTVVLPDAVARRLRSGTETRIADRIDGVTLLFADLVGFTPVAHVEDPERVVAYLDEFVRTFDLMCDTYGVDKIKTIGDAYMAAGGLHGSGRESAIAVGRLALEMLKVQERRPQLGGHKLALRVGIHSGTAIAGVIGETRISYDLWGDAVNIASRMQTQGIAGRIQVSESFRAMVADEFTFEDRGTTEIKGIGATYTYFLLGVRKPIE